MKVFYILTKFPAPAETFAASDIRGLAKKGIDVEVYAQRARDAEYLEMVSQRGLERIPIKSSSYTKVVKGLLLMFLSPLLTVSLFFRLIQDFSSLKHFFKLCALMPISFFILQEVKNRSPDVVHLFWGHYPALVGYLVLKSRLDSAVSIFLGAYDLEMKLNISGYVARNASFVFTHTYENMGALRSLGIPCDKINVVYRGVDVDYFRSENTVDIDRKKDQIVCAARLIPSKRIDKVIMLAQAAPGFDFKVFGDGPQMKALTSMVEDLGLSQRVNFTGHVSQKVMYQAFEESKFFVFLSEKKGERLPNAVKEAMLAGCVCIVSKTPGIDELISDGVDGVILKEVDVKYIAELIRGLEEEEVTMISENARRKIVNCFDSSLLLNNYIEQWE